MKEKRIGFRSHNKIPTKYVYGMIYFRNFRKNCVRRYEAVLLKCCRRATIRRILRLTLFKLCVSYIGNKCPEISETQPLYCGIAKT